MQKCFLNTGALLEGDADIDARTNDGLRPLNIAAVKGSDAVVELFLERGAKVDSRFILGFTPVKMATNKGYKAAVDQLLEKGAPLEVKVDDTFTALRGGFGICQDYYSLAGRWTKYRGK